VTQPLAPALVGAATWADGIAGGNEKAPRTVIPIAVH
jgi:hypothetical protein